MDGSMVGEKRQVATLDRLQTSRLYLNLLKEDNLKTSKRARRGRIERSGEHPGHLEL